MNLVSLPDEILSSILRNLSVSSVLSASSSCRRLHQIERGDDLLWKWYCQRDYGINDETMWDGWTFRNFYTKVLSKYSYLMGWWQRKIDHYGGLFLVKMQKNALVGYECLPPLDDSNVTLLQWAGLVKIAEGSDFSRQSYNTLRFERVFAIEPVGDEIKVVCYQSDERGVNSVVHGHCIRMRVGETDHQCNVFCRATESTVEKTGNGFRFICRQREHHNVDLAHFLRLHHGIVPNRPEHIDDVISEFDDDGYDLSIKFSALEKAICDCEFQPVHIQRHVPPAVKHACLTPGFYSSLYSVHGWEIINFTYSDDGEQLEGIKVKGDPNIPAGKVSVRVLLTKPVSLTADDQESYHTVERSIERARPGWPCQPQNQGDAVIPFRVPVDCSFDDENAERPRFCRGVYLCETQLAETGYQDPRYVESLFFAFDDSTFAVLWLEFRSYFRYYRASNIDGM